MAKELSGIELSDINLSDLNDTLERLHDDAVSEEWESSKLVVRRLEDIGATLKDIESSPFMLRNQVVLERLSRQFESFDEFVDIADRRDEFDRVRDNLNKNKDLNKDKKETEKGGAGVLGDIGREDNIVKDVLLNPLRLCVGVFGYSGRQLFC